MVGGVASIIVCGGSVIGLAAAALLARDGHQVTVLERDPAPPPVEPPAAWDQWKRAGVPQFHQPHNLHPRFRLILDEELPGTVDRLVAAGCVWLDWLALMPPLIRDRTPRPGDERFRFVAGRRPVVEAVLADVTEESGADVRRGVAVTGLRTERSVTAGAPHVIGVRTTQGEDLDADLVVDATGRRTRLADWLQATGAATAPRVESEDGGFVYHSRYFRGPELPPFNGPPTSDFGTISLLTIPGDSGTWSVTIWASSSDVALRNLRHADRFVTVGLLHAQCLRDVVRAELGDPEGLARAWDTVTERQVTPFYWSQITADRARFAEMDALRRDDEPPAPDPASTAIAAAMMRDPDVFRGVLEMTTCLALPDEVRSRPGFMDKVDTLSRSRMWNIPGPDRRALLALVGS